MPSPTDVLVPPDGLHVGGGRSAFFPVNPSGNCTKLVESDYAGKSLVSFSAHTETSSSQVRNQFTLIIDDYHGAGTYRISKRTEVAPGVAAVRASFALNGEGWAADGGTITVLDNGTGAVQGTLDVAKTFPERVPSGGSVQAVTIRGAWSCSIEPSPSPVMANG